MYQSTSNVPFSTSTHSAPPAMINTIKKESPNKLKDRPSILSLRVRTDRSGEWREGAYMKITAPIEQGQLFWRVSYADVDLFSPCFLVADGENEDALEAVGALIHGATLGIPDTSISLEIVCRGKPQKQQPSSSTTTSSTSSSSKVVAAWIIKPDLEESSKEKIIHRALKILLTK